MSHYQEFHPYITTSHVHKDNKVYASFDVSIYMPNTSSIVEYKYNPNGNPLEVHYDFRFNPAPNDDRNGWVSPPNTRVKFKGILGLFNKKEFVHFTLETKIEHITHVRVDFYIDSIQKPETHNNKDLRKRGHDGTIHFPGA